MSPEGPVDGQHRWPLRGHASPGHLLFRLSKVSTPNRREIAPSATTCQGVEAFGEGRSCRTIGERAKVRETLTSQSISWARSSPDFAIDGLSAALSLDAVPAAFALIALASSAASTVASNAAPLSPERHAWDLAPAMAESSR